MPENKAGESTTTSELDRGLLPSLGRALNPTVGSSLLDKTLPLVLTFLYLVGLVCIMLGVIPESIQNTSGFVMGWGIISAAGGVYIRNAGRSVK